MSKTRSINRASQQYQRRFHSLIEERERVGISLEKMSAMLGEMAVADADLYAAVTEEQLRAVEEDPLHGMSIPAMMYVRFMMCNISIVGKPGSKATFTQFHEHELRKRGWSSEQIRGSESLLRSMGSGETTPMTISVFGVDRYGANIDARVAFKHITDEEAAEIIGILLRAQVRRRVDGKRGSAAMRERYDIFKAAKQRRKEAKKLVSEALSEKVEPPDVNTP